MFAMLAAAVVGALGLVGKYLEGSDYIGRRVAALEAIDNGETVVTGASIARHIELGALCLEGKNLWEPRQDIFEIVAFQRHLEDRGIVPSLWIIGYIPGFTTIDKGADAARRADRRTVAYRTLQGAGDYRLIGGDWQGALRSIATPVLGYPEWRIRVKAASAGRPFDTEQSASDVAELDSERLRQQSRRWRDIAFAEQERLKFHDDGIARRAIDAIASLNVSLRRQGSQLVLVEMPVTAELEAYGYGVTPEVVAREERLFEWLEAQGAAIVRLSDLPDQPRARFRDFMHLTRSAGWAFSRELGEELKGRGLIDRLSCAVARTGL